MRDCMQFEDGIRRYAICRHAICALEMQEMRQSARAINVWISHQWMALNSVAVNQKGNPESVSYHLQSFWTYFRRYKRRKAIPINSSPRAVQWIVS